MFQEGVVVQREKRYRHVVFSWEETATESKLLGGNQQNLENKLFEVSEKCYPKTELLGYRILKQTGAWT